MCYRAASLLQRHQNIVRPWLSWIERQTTNLDVASSNLAGRTILYQGVGKFLPTLFIIADIFISHPLQSTS